MQDKVSVIIDGLSKETKERLQELLEDLTSKLYMSKAKESARLSRLIYVNNKKQVEEVFENNE